MDGFEFVCMYLNKYFYVNNLEFLCEQFWIKNYKKYVCEIIILLFGIKLGMFT